MGQAHIKYSNHPTNFTHIVGPKFTSIKKLTLIIHMIKENNISSPIQQAQTHNQLTIDPSSNKQYAIDIIQISQINHQMQYNNKSK